MKKEKMAELSKLSLQEREPLEIVAAVLIVNFFV